MADDDPAINDLIERARRGDAAVLGRLLERQRAALRALADRRLGTGIEHRVDASDVLQQTFLEAHRDFPAFRGSTEADLVAWLRQILEHAATRAVRDHAVLRKRAVGRERPLDAAPGEDLAAGLSSPSRRAIRVEEALRLARALDTLPPDQREAVRLRHLEGRSLDEIAGRLGRSPSAAAGLIKRGMQALRRHLADDSGTTS